jgi:hypothetical protein
MGWTVPSHVAHLLFRWHHRSMRRLPLQTDCELKHQQRGDHEACRSATHNQQRTLLAVLSKGLFGLRRDPIHRRHQDTGRNEGQVNCDHPS